MKPRERRRQRTREAILEAALELVQRGGVEAVAMRELAEQISYSPAALYEYFDSKEAILQVLCERGFQRLAAYMSRVGEDLPLAEYMLGIGQAYIRFADEHPDYFQLMFSQVGPTRAAGEPVDMPPPEMTDPDSSFGILVAGIKRGIESGEFVTRAGFGWLEMAYSAWATVHGLAMLRSSNLRSVDYNFDAADRQALANLYRGLTSRQ